MYTFLYLEEINLDSDLISPSTPEVHHADSVVVLFGADVRVHLPLAVLLAQLASFRQKRAKSDGAGAAKKTQKRKGQVDSQNDRSTEDHHVEPALPSASATEHNNSTNHEVCRQLPRELINNRVTNTEAILICREHKIISFN